MNSSRTSRWAACSILLLGALLAGCQDDLPPPTMAPVQLRFLAEPMTLARGAQVWIDDHLVTDSLTVGSLDTLLAAGRHTIRIRKDCVRVEPAESLGFEVAGGRPAQIDLRFGLRCSLLSLRFHSTVEGLARGAQIWLDGRIATDSLTTDEYSTLLEPGDHSLVVRKECVTVDPAESLAVHLEEGSSSTIDIQLIERAVLSVLSDPTGLPVWIDGAPTGLTTPAAFPCIVPGGHEVRVHPPGNIGFTVIGDSVQSAVVGSSGITMVSFAFSTEPLPQSRGVLIELFTFVLCENCPEPDHLIDALDRDPAFEEESLVPVEVHLPAAGDPFNTDEINARRVTYYYGNDGISAPIAYFNGGGKLVNQTEILESSRARVLRDYGTDAKAALYWRNVRVEGTLLRGDLRLVPLDDLSGYRKLQLHTFYAKDSLTAFPDPWGVGYFNSVARDYLDDPVDLNSVGATGRGDVYDLAVSFDTAPDAGKPSRALRLVAFVQDSTTKEILQCREARVRAP